MKIIVEDQLDDNTIRYSFVIEKDALLAMDLPQENITETIIMLMKKIESEKAMKNIGQSESIVNEDLGEMFIDHLVTDLQNRSIAGILNFLARYCGWERIQSYVSRKILERNKS